MPILPWHISHKYHTESRKLRKKQDKIIRENELSGKAFYGDMKWLIDDLYEILEFDPDFVDFYDLFYVLKTPARVSFYYKDKRQDLESLMEGGACVVHFNDKWYHDRDEFFSKAVIDDKKLTDIYDDLYGFEVTGIEGDH